MHITAPDTLILISILPWVTIIWSRLSVAPADRILACILIVVVHGAIVVGRAKLSAPPQIASVIGVSALASLTILIVNTARSYFLPNFDVAPYVRRYLATAIGNLVVLVGLLTSIAAGYWLPWVLAALTLILTASVSLHMFRADRQEFLALASADRIQSIETAEADRQSFLENRKSERQRSAEAAERAAKRASRVRRMSNALRDHRQQGEQLIGSRTHSRMSLELDLLEAIYHWGGSNKEIRLIDISAATGEDINVTYTIGATMAERGQVELINRYEPATKFVETAWMQHITLKVTRSGIARLENSTRSLHASGEPSNSSLKARASVLYVTANPMLNLRTEKEVASVRRALNKSTHQVKLTLTHLPAATATDMIEGLNNATPRILHIAAHSQDGVLLLESEGDDLAPQEVSNELMSRLLQATPYPPTILVLNACSSFVLAEELSNLCDVMVATLFPINDSAAAVFSSYFYEALAAGQPLKYAIDQGGIGVDLSRLDDGWKWQAFTKEGIDLSTFRL